MNTNIWKKKIGIGSLSLIFFLMGLLFSAEFSNGICYGDKFLNLIGLRCWSSGNKSGLHLTYIYSNIFYVIAIVIGQKYKGNLFAKTGKVLSIVFLILFIIFIIFGSVYMGVKGTNVIID